MSTADRRPGTYVHDLRHRYSLELRPDPATDARLRGITAALESEGLLPAGSVTAPRFHPHLTLLRSAAPAQAGMDAVARSLHPRVEFTQAGTFGDGRIVFLQPSDSAAMHAARAVAAATVPPARLDPLVTERAWTPHVTLAYNVPDEARAAALATVRAALPITGRWGTVQAWDLDVRPTELVHCAPLQPLPQIATERLLLRRWRDEDRDPWAELNRDPEVVEFLPGPLTRAESDAMLDRMEAHHEQHGFGLWAVQRRDTGQLAGFVGLSSTRFDAHFTPAVEVGWRLARGAWGHGFATEAARAVLDAAFGPLGFSELVSFTVPDNRRSRAVMERIGMREDPAGRFEHSALPKGHPLRPHVLYRIDAGAHAQHP